jgi:uncharacterized protein (DUF2267 family)
MNFEQYAGDANIFVKEIAGELGDPNDYDSAYRVMRSVFHTMREVLSPEESLHLISQLPLIIKGVYVDGWRLQTQDRIRSMPEFIECLKDQNQPMSERDFADDQTAKRAVKSVFGVLKKHVSAGEIQHVINQFPMELMELWEVEESDRLVEK